MACRFARAGWFIGIADIDHPGMAATAALMPAGKSSIHPLDVRDRAAWDRALSDFSSAAGGRIDVVFNNAGIPLGGAAVAAAPDEIRQILDVNLLGVIFGAQAAYPHLKHCAPGSCLLNIASAAAFYGTPGTAIYSATKFGVRGLTEVLDAEWAADGIKVCDLMPGFTDTPLLDKPPHRGARGDIRYQVKRAGQEIVPVEAVAEAAWAAVHADRLHTPVGKLARRMAFAARWMPTRLRRQMRGTGR